MRPGALAGVLAAVALVASGCGSSGGGSAGGSSSPGGSGSGTTGAIPVAHLTTAQGLAVYLFAPDTGGRSTCYGGCARAWPPVPAGTKLAATSGTVAAGRLGTTTRKDGSKQLTFAGHPLYRYIADTKAGETSGQGLNASGGLWWLVSSSGSAIMSGASSPTGTGSTGSSGGYGY